MADPLRLDLPVLLPEIPDARDACAVRLIDALAATPGVSLAHVVDAADGQPAQLCLHYDPAVVALPQLRRTAEQAGAQITGRFGHVLWEVRGLGHQTRARTVTTRLAKLPGVAEATANARGPLRIEFDRAATSEARLREALDRLGVTVVDKQPAEVPVTAHDAHDHAGHDHDDHAGHDHDDHAGHDHDDHDDEHAGHDHGPGGHSHGHGAHGGHAHGGIFGERTEIIFAGLSGVCVALGWGLGAFAGLPESASFGLYLAAIFFGGWFTVSEAVGSIRAGRFEIDFLMIVAAAGAAALGEWFEAALLLALFSIGHGLEGYAMGRARRAIEALSELAPETAIVRRDGAEQEIPVGDLRVGDTVVVRTNARLPADGFVSKGTSAVNQAPVTGESVPVDKQPVADRDAALAAPDTVGPASRVFAGTLNGTGALEVVVTRTSGESTLARVVKMVAEAETEQSPTQRFTDRFERIFVPAVLGLVVALLVGPPALKALGVWITEPFSASFYRAMAVLVAASPCALAIATPSAVLSGVARAGRQGVLVKGGGPLEALGAVQVIAFDKTGTLTEGAPRVVDVVPTDGATEAELLEAAVAVERLSDHPLARAVVTYGDEKGAARVEAHDLQSVTGFGVRATLGGEAVAVGKAAMFEGGLPANLTAEVERLEADGRTTFVVQRGARFLGVVGLMDAPRAAARDTIARLRALGVQRMVMISGDNQRVADAVARAVGLDEARGDLLPDDKVAAIKALAAEGRVAMVGDGVNDAPAMASATVGIAMGAAGSDVALETADIALMGDDLAQLPFAVGLSRHTRGIIRQNLWISLGMVAFLVPATLWGLHIGPAVALHEGSTLVVVFNALRLLAYRDGGHGA